MSWGTPVGAGNLATASATTIAVTLTGVSVGDLIVVWVKWEGGSTTATCSDSTSTLTGWAPGAISRPSADPFGKAFYLLASVVSGTVTYTVTFGAARTFREVVAYRVTPSASASLDGTAVGNNGSSTTVSSGNITTTSTDGLAFGFYGDFGNFESAEKINGVVAGGNTHAGANASEAWYKTYAAGFTGAATCTLGISNDWLGGIIAFGIGGGGTTFTDSVSESVSAAESQSAAALLPGTVAETLAAAETESATALLPAARTESLTAADAQTGAIATPATISESVTSVDTQTGAVATPASIAESVTATTTQDATVVAGGASAVAESVTASDAVSATVTFAGAVSEAAAAADAVSASATLVAVRVESVAALDSIVATLLLQGIVVEVLAAIDGESVTATFAGSVHEILAASEIVTAAGGIVQPEYPPGRFTLDDIQPRFALDDISPRFTVDDPQATFTLREDYPA